MDTPPERKSSSFKVLLIIFFFVFLIFIRNFAFWSKSQTFIFGDTSVYSLYLVALAKNILHPEQLIGFKDNFFLWNPHYLLGTPTLSVTDLGMLYPPNIIIALLAGISKTALNTFPLYSFFVFLHLILGAIFVFKILQKHWGLDNLSSLVGGFLWTFIGFNLEFMSAASIMISGSYLPACIYFSLNLSKEKNKKSFFLLFLLLALSFLVGYPMVSLLILIFSFFTLFFSQNPAIKTDKIRAIMIYLVGLFFITLPLISILYFSSAINFSNTVRTSLSSEGFLQNPAQLSESIEAIIPRNTPLDNLSSKYPIFLYFSLIGIVFILLNRNKSEFIEKKQNLLMLIAGLSALIFCLGRLTPIPAITYFLVPGINLFRRLQVFSLIPGFVFCLFAAISFKNALTEKNYKKIFYSIIVGFAILIIFQIISIALSGQKDSIVNYSALQQSVGLPLFLLILIFLALKLLSLSPKLAIYLIFLAILVEGGNTVSSRIFLNSKIDPQIVYGPNTITNFLQQRVKPAERIDIAGSQNSYSTDFLNLEQTLGYVSMANKYAVAINQTMGREDYDPRNLTNIIGVKYIVKRGIVPPVIGEKIFTAVQDEKNPEFFVFSDPSSLWTPDFNKMEYSVYSNPFSLDRVYLASSLKPFEQTEKVLYEIEKLDDIKTVFVKQSDLKQDITEEGSLNVLEYKRNYLKVSTRTPQPAFLANTTTYYPGWKVKINGRQEKLIQANWFMFGVFVPSGENTIEFYYLPYGIIAGGIYLAIALVSWLLFKKRLLNVV